MSSTSTSVDFPFQAQIISITVDDILGAAIFDLNGLPREYFITAENANTSWVQIVFQALGLKPLLMSSLELEGFHHISTTLEQNTAVVVRGKNTYVALLLRGSRVFYSFEEADHFSQWTRQFEQTTLRQHDRFRPV